MTASPTPAPERSAPLIDPTAEARRVAGLVIKSLTDLGYAWQTQVGDVVQVRFDSIGLADLLGATWAICEVDTLRLPRRVTARDLTKPETLHHLATVCGHPVRCLNSTGVTYCIQLTPARRAAPPRLPRQVLLDLDQAPAPSHPGELLVPLGVGYAGPLWRPLSSLGHTLITGASGSGKSNWLHAALAALLTTARPEALRLALVDPKVSEFAAWAQSPHLWRIPTVPGGVAHDEQQAVVLLTALIDEMDRRGQLLAGALARDLAGYNRRAANPLPYLLIVIDEVLDVLLAAGGERSDLARALTRLAVKGRSNGILLWIASQHARFDLLPRAVGLNLASRLVFRVQDANAATLAGCPGAERIPRERPGRFLARLDAEPIPVQAYHVDDEQLRHIAQGLGAPTAPAPLVPPEQAALVRYALEHLDGCFIVGKLAAAFAGEWTHYRIAALARTWEARGWLSKPAHATDARRVMGELLGEYGVGSMEHQRLAQGVGLNKTTGASRPLTETRP